MAVNTRINLRGGFVGSVGGAPIPYRFGGTSRPAGLIQLLTGTGATQAQVAFQKTFSISASGNQDIDFTSGETDINNVAVNLTYVKLVYIELTSPTANYYLKVGPQNVTNGWTGWWDSNDADSYDKCHGKLLQVYENGTGWAVDGTHKVLRLNNPSAGTVAGYIWVLGI